MAAPINRTPGMNSYTIRDTGLTVRRGDCVLIRPAESDSPPYLARVDKLVPDQNNNNNMMIRIRWYYRPEDVIGGRRSFHGAKEVFLSNDCDLLSVDTIDGKCVVHNFQKYMKLKFIGHDDYYCRYQYDAGERPASTAGHRFTPKLVTVYCDCELPYNPDKFMVQCDECHEWYHPSCLGLTDGRAKMMKKFICFKCHNDAK